jgi:AmiR/NasT family two-component response regulator
LSKNAIKIGIFHPSMQTVHLLRAAAGQLGYSVCFSIKESCELGEEICRCSPSMLLVPEEFVSSDTVTPELSNVGVPLILICESGKPLTIPDLVSPMVAGVLHSPIRQADLASLLPMAAQHFERLSKMRENIQLLKDALQISEDQQQ